MKKSNRTMRGAHRLLSAAAISGAILTGPGAVGGERVSAIKCGPALPLQWRRLDETYERFRPEYAVTRAKAEKSKIRLIDLDPGDVLFGENDLTVTLGNEAEQGVRARVELSVEGSVEIVGPSVLAAELAQVSPEPYQGKVIFKYRVKERNKPARLKVRVLDENGVELSSGSRGVIMPFYARLYADTCRVWQGDKELGFRIKYQLSATELEQAGTALILSRGKRNVWKEELSTPTDRIMRGKIDVSGLAPGDYELTARLRLGNGKAVETSVQKIEVTAVPRITKARIPLHVGVLPDNPGGVQPVTGGVPFPDGVLESSDNVRVVDAKGNEIPSQADVTEYWVPSKRFIRWLLVSFSAAVPPTSQSPPRPLGERSDREAVRVRGNVSPDSKQQYFLEYGSKVSRKKGRDLAELEVDANGDVAGVHIDTDVLRFDIDRDLGLQSEVRIDGEWLTAAKGKLALSMQTLNRNSLEVLNLSLDDPEGVKFMTFSRTGWRFKADREDTGIKERWYDPKLDDSEWTRVRIETFWEKQGFGDLDGAGWYRTIFDVPEDIIGRQLALYFNAVDEHGHVYVNGIDCGSNEDVEPNKAWVTPYSVDVTGAVKAGRNDLAVRVHDSGGAGGIWKPVELRLVNPTPEGLKRAALDDPASGTYAAASAVITVEENGPERTVVRLNGNYIRGEVQGNPFQVRIIARRGSSCLQLEHTFVFDMDPVHYLVGPIRLEWPAIGNRLSVPGPEAVLTGNRKVALKTLSCDRYSVTVDGSAQEVSGRPLGWVDVAGDKTGTMIMLRDIWQQFPGAVDAQSGKAGVFFNPPGHLLDLRNTEEHSPSTSARGVAKTHRVFILAHEAAASGLAVRAARLDAPPTLAADTQWVNTSDVVGPQAAYNPGRYPDEEKGLESIHRGFALQQDAYKVYGMLDYGDMHHKWDRKKKRWDENYRYWVNNETTYDPNTYYCWKYFLHRPEPDICFRFFEARQLHLIDVDTCHSKYRMPERVSVPYVADGEFVPGVQHKHALQHWSGPLCMHHTTIEDALLFFYVTGNRRGLDAAEELRYSNLRMQLPGLGAPSFRDFSMPGRNAFELYTHFGDPRLLDYAVDTWETMLVYHGLGERALRCYRRRASLMADERWQREFMAQNVVDESDLPDFAEECRDKPDAFTFLGDKAGAEFALGFLKGMLGYGHAGIRGPLSQYGDRIDDSPIGYGWNAQVAGMYLYYMELPVRAGVADPASGMVKATKQGGNWSDPTSWEDGKVPGRGNNVIVPAGSSILYNGPATPSVTCGSVTVAGALTFAGGKHVLVARGDVVVKKGGAISMGPGSELRVSCKWDGDFGIIVEPEGALNAKGTSPEKRDCRIGAFRTDGTHNTYVHFKPGALCRLENTEISYLGRGPLLRWNQGWPDLYKLGLMVQKDEAGCVIRGCDIHHCLVGIAVQSGSAAETPLGRIENNNVHECETGLLIGHQENLRINGNTVRNCSRLGIDLRGRAVYTKGWLTNNRIAGNPVGIELRQTAGQKLDISGNVYEDNDIAMNFIYENYPEPPILFKNENIKGGRIGIQVEARKYPNQTKVNFEDCRIGVDKPNTEANVMFGTTHGELIFKNCIFPEPRKVVGEKGLLTIVEE